MGFGGQHLIHSNVVILIILRSGCLRTKEIKKIIISQIAFRVIIFLREYRGLVSNQTRKKKTTWK